MITAMKLSGIPWVGEIPADWRITQIRTEYDQVQNENCRMQETNLLSLSYGKIVTKDIDHTFGLVPANYSTYNIVKRDDIVLRPTDMQNDQISLRTGLVTEPQGIITSAYVTLRAKNGFSHYGYYFLYAFDVTKEIYNYGQGVRQSLSWAELKKYLMPVPPLAEQRAISKLLDDRCTKLNRLIADLMEQIRTLSKQKEALITETVTKGLNKRAPLKYSNYDIVGNTPAHWSTKRLRYVCDVCTGSQDTQDAVPDGEYPFYVRSPVVERIDKYVFDGEAVLMAGDGAGAGRIFHYVNGKFGCHQRVYILHNFGDINPRFFYYYVSRLFSVEIEKGSAKSTVDSARLPMLRNFVICIPPKQEQTEIVSHLDRQCSIIDGIISQREKQLETMKSYKYSLITEYVTGRKRVKEVT